MADPQQVTMDDIRSMREQGGARPPVAAPGASPATRQSVSPEDVHRVRGDAASQETSMGPQTTWGQVAHGVGNWLEHPIDKTKEAVSNANQYYNQVDPNQSRAVRVGQSLGRTAMMPVNLASAVASPATDEEKKQGFGGAAQFGPLQAHRLVVAPSDNTETMLENQETSDAAHGMPHSAVERYGMRAVNSIPVVGPWMINEGQRAGSGDIAGAATDVGTMLAVPKLAKEAMPGGSLPGAAAKGESAIPITSGIANRAVRGVSSLADRALTPRGLTTAVTGGAGLATGVEHYGLPGVLGGTAGELGSRASDYLYENPDQPLSPKIPGVRSVLPKMRTVGSDKLITPAQVEQNLADNPEQTIASTLEQEPNLRVVVPGGKTKSFADFVKDMPQRGAPKTWDQLGLRPVINGGDLGRYPAEEFKLTPPEMAEPGETVEPPNVGKISGKQTAFKFRPVTTPEELKSVEYVGGAKEGEPMPGEQPPTPTRAEVRNAAQETVNEMTSSTKPAIDSKVEGQLRHVIGDYATDNLIDTPEGAATAAKLKGMTYNNYADVANYEGILKPKSLVAKTGKEWSPADFGRSTAEHGKELNPYKEQVIRHLVDNYGPDEINERVDGMGRK